MRKRCVLVDEFYSQNSKHVQARWIMTIMSSIIHRFIYLPFYKLVLLFSCLRCFCISFLPLLVTDLSVLECSPRACVVDIVDIIYFDALYIEKTSSKQEQKKTRENVRAARSLSSNDGFNNSILSFFPFLFQIRRYFCEEKKTIDIIRERKKPHYTDIHARSLLFFFFFFFFFCGRVVYFFSCYFFFSFFSSSSSRKYTGQANLGSAVGM